MRDKIAPSPGDRAVRAKEKEYTTFIPRLISITN
jgi:hypothetical protein